MRFEMVMDLLNFLFVWDSKNGQWGSGSKTTSLLDFERCRNIAKERAILKISQRSGIFLSDGAVDDHEVQELLLSRY